MNKIKDTTFSQKIFDDKLLEVGKKLLMLIFDKRAQWQKKPNNMKEMKKENSKVKTIGLEWRE